MSLRINTHSIDQRPTGGIPSYLCPSDGLVTRGMLLTNESRWRLLVLGRGIVLVGSKLFIF